MGEGWFSWVCIGTIGIKDEIGIVAISDLASEILD